MKIIGIDPGTATTGYGLLDINGSEKPKLVKFGWIKTDKDGSPEKRLGEIYKEMLKILNEYSPDVMAIERLFFYSNAKTAIRVGQAQGVILLAANQKRIKVFEYPPAQVKKLLSGNGRADKMMMKQKVRKIFGVRSPRKKKTHFDDVADAIAVALCHAKILREGGEK